MTDRLPDDPGLGAADSTQSADQIAEAAPDLTDAQLAAANDLASAEIEEAGAGGDTLDESEEIDEEIDEGEVDVDDEAGADAAAEEAGIAGAAAAGAAARPGARARAAETAAARAGRQTKDRAPTRQTFAVDPALRIRDPWSQAFVIVAIGFFVLVFLYAMALGKGGAFNPVPTPTPVVSSSPAPSDSAGPSGSPGASGSTAAPSLPPTLAPTAAPTAAPSST